MKSEKQRPYIAVTGLTDPRQVGELEIPTIEGYDIMLGVLVSSKSILGLNTRKRYPVLRVAAETLAAVNALKRDDVLGAFHYNTRAPFRTADLEDMESACANFGAKVNVIQLNVSSHELVKTISGNMTYPQGGDWSCVKIVYQLNRSITKKFGVLGTLAYFDGCRPEHTWQYALFDMSGGRGNPMDKNAAQEFKGLRHKFPLLQLGVAGGIMPTTIGQTIKLVGSDMSYDVEGQVRDDDDELDVERVNHYLRNAEKALR